MGTAELPFDPVQNNPAEIQNAPKLDKDEDTIIKDSIHLSELGQFDAALGKLKSISSDSANYVYARDRMRQISNNAANELRKKAATEYQSAQGVHETKLKANFLERAKKYLEDALEKYPDSDQKKTITENLNMIERDLKR